MNLVCCTDDGLSQLYVGVQETEPQERPYNAAPIGDARLPESVVDNFEVFLDRQTVAVINGQSTEDRTQGHATAESSPVRHTQEILLAQAEQHMALLTNVLEHSSDARHRAIAAHVLGYARDKAVIAPILASAVLDPDPEVRNYATRSLAVIAEFANLNPDLGIEIPLVGLPDDEEERSREPTLSSAMALIP